MQTPEEQDAREQGEADATKYAALVEQARDLIDVLADYQRRMTQPESDFEAMNDKRLEQVERTLVMAQRRLDRRNARH